VTDAGAGCWIDDAMLGAIGSPLGGNRTLQTCLARISSERALLAEGRLSVEDEERHAEAVGRLADHLRFMENAGELRRWEWEACFLEWEDFRDLYDSAMHWWFEDTIAEEAREATLHPEWLSQADYSRQELQNLATVLKRVDFDGVDAARVQLSEALRT
jgi:hypothetical protein